MDAVATLTACCDLDLWPPESNQVIITGSWTAHRARFTEIALAIHEILCTRSVLMDGRLTGLMFYISSDTKTGHFGEVLPSQSLGSVRN